MKKTDMIPTDIYLEHIRIALAEGGIPVADTFNKMSLEAGAVTIEQYLAAARILVDAFLAQ